MLFLPAWEWVNEYITHSREAGYVSERNKKLVRREYLAIDPAIFSVKTRESRGTSHSSSPLQRSFSEYQLAQCDSTRDVY